MKKLDPGLPSFKPSLSSSAPLADQLADFFRHLIQTGRLAEGALLPPVAEIPGISHVTAIHAYRKLARERLVRVRRGHGTVILTPPSMQYYAVVSHVWGNLVSFYESEFLLRLRRGAVYKDRPAEVYLLGPGSIPDLKTAEGSIPPALREDVDSGRVRGVFLAKTSHYPGLIEWLQRRRMPLVSFEPWLNVPLVAYDNVDLYRRGLNFLAAEGCRKIAVFAVNAAAADAMHQDVAPAGMLIDWYTRSVTLDTHPALRQGEQWIAELWAGRRQRPDALLVSDDVAGIGVVLALARLGVRIPQDIRVVVATRVTQLLDAFAGCDLCVVDPCELVQAGMDVMTACIEADPGGPVPVRSIPYKIYPGGTVFPGFGNAEADKGC